MTNKENMPARPRPLKGPGFVIASEKRLGRCKRAVRREFILSDGQPILACQVIDRAFPRIKRVLDWHRWSVRRALIQEAEIVGRNRFGRGRPNLWVPKPCS
jgi:hypothetical protein